MCEEMPNEVTGAITNTFHWKIRTMTGFNPIGDGVFRSCAGSEPAGQGVKSEPSRSSAEC